MHAVRLARGYTRKSKILKFDGGFHGSHDSVLAKRGTHGSLTSTPSSKGIPVDTSRNTLVANYNDTKTATKIMEDHGHELAAVIVEPVAGNMGPIPPAKGFLQSLRKHTKENGVLLIFDEVITGFRLSLGGAQEYFGVRPDLTTLGKIVGGGFPLAAFGGRREIMQKLSPLGPVYQAGTYSGNPISVAAGLTTLQSLKKRSINLYTSMEKHGRLIADGIRDSIESLNVLAQVNQIGSMFQIFFTERKVTDYGSAQSSDSSKYDRFFRSLLMSKVFVPPSQLESCFLSTSHTKHDLQQTIEAFDDSLRSVGS
jgi:glutamate-1-semialdehyde 2,1-aminomutase